MRDIDPDSPQSQQQTRDNAAYVRALQMRYVTLYCAECGFGDDFPLTDRNGTTAFCQECLKETEFKPDEEGPQE